MARDNWNELKQKIVEFGRELFDAFAKNADETIKKLLSSDAIKCAINYEEKYARNYTAKEMIQWFKENYKKGYDPCVYMVQVERDGQIHYKIHHLFIDIEKKEPCLDGSYPYRQVIALDLDDDIRKMFKSNNLLILR